MLNTNNSLKTRIKNGETLAGIFVSEMRTSNYGPLLDAAGCDFAMFDLEHCPFSMADLATMLPGFRGFRAKPMVRVPAIRRDIFQPLLDLGIRGFMVPMVENPEDVRAALSLIKYPPHGIRGIHCGTPHTLFQGVDRDTYTRAANNDILLVIQIETTKGLANLDAILAEPGIDVAFVGNGDLASFMGAENNLNGGPLFDNMRRILRSAQKLGIPGGGNFLDPKFAGQFYDDGLRFIMVNDEAASFMGGLRRNMEGVRAVLPAAAKIHPLAPKGASAC